MYRPLNKKERKIVETKLFQAVDDIMALLSSRKFKFDEDQIPAVIKHATKIERHADMIDTLMVSSWCQRNKITLEPDLITGAREAVIIREGRATDNSIIGDNQ